MAMPLHGITLFCSKSSRIGNAIDCLRPTASYKNTAQIGECPCCAKTCAYRRVERRVVRNRTLHRADAIGHKVTVSNKPTSRHNCPSKWHDSSGWHKQLLCVGGKFCNSYTCVNRRSGIR